jgi:hypothetical protein
MKQMLRREHLLKIWFLFLFGIWFFCNCLALYKFYYYGVKALIPVQITFTARVLLYRSLVENLFQKSQIYTRKKNISQIFWLEKWHNSLEEKIKVIYLHLHHVLFRVSYFCNCLALYRFNYYYFKEKWNYSLIRCCSCSSFKCILFLFTFWVFFLCNHLLCLNVDLEFTLCNFFSCNIFSLCVCLSLICNLTHERLYVWEIIAENK